MREAAALDSHAVASNELFQRSTIEVTVRDAEAGAVLKDHLPRGSGVHITYLSNGAPAEAVAQAVALAKAGFEPIPHVAARGLSGPDELQDYVERITGEAGASRVLLIAGDMTRPRGPYSGSFDVLKTGVFEGAGLTGVGFASHPEEHPVVPTPVLEKALMEKLYYAAAHGLEAEIVTQFCFDARTIVDHVARLRGLGASAPVRIGLAAPTSAALMMKFALRCGIGPSLRVLQSQSARLGRLMVTGPEGQIAELARSTVAQDLAGLHFFVFGGVRKAAAWLQAQRAAALAGDGGRG